MQNNDLYAIVDKHNQKFIRIGNENHVIDMNTDVMEAYQLDEIQCDNIISYFKNEINIGGFWYKLKLLFGKV